VAAERNKGGGTTTGCVQRRHLLRHACPDAQHERPALAGRRDALTAFSSIKNRPGTRRKRGHAEGISQACVCGRTKK